jgi:hypothetical protein
LLCGGTGIVYGSVTLNSFSSAALIVVCSLRLLFELFGHGKEHATKVVRFSFVEE